MDCFYHGRIYLGLFLPRDCFYLGLFLPRIVFTSDCFYHGKHGRAWKDTEEMDWQRGGAMRRILTEHAPHGKARKQAELCLLLCNKVPSAFMGRSRGSRGLR